MRHVKSNLNILKPNKNINMNLKPSKSNKNFKKSPTTLQIIENNLDLKTINNNNYFNFFDKSCKNSAFNSIVFSSNKNSNSPPKKNNFNKKNKINKTNYNSSCNTIFNNTNSASANRGISIRLNFKNKIINNNFIKKNKTNKNKSNNSNHLKNLNINNNNNYKYDFNINERIKEKDKQITLLQKDLLQSQKLLNQLQEEKQKEISSTYNTIKNVDNILNYNNNNSINANHSGMSKYSSLSNFFASNSEKNLRILKTVYGKRNLANNKSNSKKKLYGSKNKTINKSKKKNNLNLYINTTSLAKFNYFNNNLINPNTNKNCKTRNNIHKNYNLGNFNSGPNSNTNKKTKDLSQNKLMRLFSYSPNKIIPSYLYNYDSNSKTSKNTLRKNINNYNIIHNIISKSPLSAQNRVNNKKIINTINGSKSKDLNYIINKGEDLKKRTKNLLNNYIMLSYQINGKIINNN